MDDGVGVPLAAGLGAVSAGPQIMTMRRLSTATAVLGGAAALLLLAGCAAPAGGPEGTWGSSGEGEPQLVLEPGGALSGTDGCNRLVGSWTAEGATVDFGEVASTMMACSNVDTWLSTLSTGTVDGNTLH